MNDLSRIFVLILILFPGSLSAGWEIKTRKETHAGPARWTFAEIEVGNEDNRVSLQLVYLPPESAQWCVVPNLSNDFDGAASAAKSQSGIAGINGGYFESDLSPIGLLVSKGKRIHSMQKANGCGKSVESL